METVLSQGFPNLRVYRHVLPHGAARADREGIQKEGIEPPSTPLMVSEKSSQAYTTQGGRGSSAWCCLQCLSNPGVLRSTHSLSAHTPYLRRLRSVQRSGGSRMWNPGPSFGFQGVNPRWTLKINCFPTAKT